MELKQARNWYTWLWVAPFITLPIVYWLYSIHAPERVGGYVCTVTGLCDPFYSRTLPSFAIAFTPILFYGIIALLAWRQEDDFIRWHGFQAFILGAIYTAIPATAVLLFESQTGLIFSVPILAIVWYLGNRWGQRQVTRNKCSLAGMFGYLEISSPALARTPPESQPPFAPPPPTTEPADTTPEPVMGGLGEKIQQALEDLARPKPAPRPEPSAKPKKLTLRSLWNLIVVIITILWLIISILGETSSNSPSRDSQSAQTSQAQENVQTTAEVLESLTVSNHAQATPIQDSSYCK